jgi:hypothetical protein
VLASGSGLIEDVRRAPDDVLSAFESRNEVCQCAKRRAHTHKDYLALSTRIHTRLIEPGGYIHHGRNPFQVNAGYCSYFQGGPRRTRHGHG